MEIPRYVGTKTIIGQCGPTIIQNIANLATMVFIACTNFYDLHLVDEITLNDFINEIYITYNKIYNLTIFPTSCYNCDICMIGVSIFTMLPI